MIWILNLVRGWDALVPTFACHRAYITPRYLTRMPRTQWRDYRSHLALNASGSPGRSSKVSQGRVMSGIFLLASCHCRLTSDERKETGGWMDLVML